MYGNGRGVYIKQDGTPGKATANLYSLRLSDMPEDIQAAVEEAFTVQLARVSMDPYTGE